MRDEQAGQIVDLLGELIDEVRGLRSDFDEFTGYNVDSMNSVAERIVEDVGDRVTGSIAGGGGATLVELSARLSILTATIR